MLNYHELRQIHQKEKKVTVNAFVVGICLTTAAIILGVAVRMACLGIVAVHNSTKITNSSMTPKKWESLRALHARCPDFRTIGVSCI
jgi:hypothetical protein